MDRQVIAVGDVNVDILLTGLGGLPRFEQEIVAEGLAIVVGGQTGTLARALARLGSPVTFVGRVGDDAYGRMAVEQLIRDGVDAVVRRDSDVRTGVTVVLASGPQRAYVTYLGSIAGLRRSDVPPGLLGGAQHLHVGSYYLLHALRPDLPGLFAEAQRVGLTTSLDPGWDPSGQWSPGIFNALCHVDVFLPNEAEALAMTGTTSVHEALTILSEHAGTVVIKRGSRGCLAVNRQGSVSLPAFEVEVVDVTSAGDAFNAGFLYGFLSGWDLETAACFASACGAIAVTRVGSAGLAASAAEVEAFLMSRAT